MEFILAVAVIIFSAGFINSLYLKNKNILKFLICIEFSFLGLNFLFIIFGFMLLDFNFFFFSLLILIFSVVDSAIGLSLCLLMLKRQKEIEIRDF